MIVFQIVLQGVQRQEYQDIVELVALGEKARQYLVVRVTRRDDARRIQGMGRNRELVAGAQAERLAQLVADHHAGARVEGAKFSVDDVPGDDVARSEIFHPHAA